MTVYNIFWYWVALVALLVYTDKSTYHLYFHFQRNYCKHEQYSILSLTSIYCDVAINDSKCILSPGWRKLNSSSIFLHVSDRQTLLQNSTLLHFYITWGNSNAPFNGPLTDYSVTELIITQATRICNFSS